MSDQISTIAAKRGTRPSAPRDQGTASAYIFGAICPAEGKGAGLVLPSCNSEAMALHLEEWLAAVELFRFAKPLASSVASKVLDQSRSPRLRRCSLAYSSSSDTPNNRSKKPQMTSREAETLARLLCGIISPYPTVLIVTIEK